MPRKRPEQLDPAERQRILDEFWTMVALLETKEEVRNFFKDLLSPTEAVMLARRVQIGKLLLSGKGYDDIQERLSTSPVTVASVHRWLEGGSGGYLKSLPKLEQELVRRQKEAEHREAEREPFTSAWMRRKYPLHYLLVNLLQEDLTPPKKLRSGKNR